MPPRFYFCRIIGDGSPETPFRTSASRHILRPDSWDDLDMRAESDSPIGEMLTFVFDATAVEHGNMLADPDITWLPFEELGLRDKVELLTSAQRARLFAVLTSRHIPVQLMTPFMTVKTVVNRVSRRLLLRQILCGDDFTATQVLRQGGRVRLTERGFDLSQATLEGLLAQDNKWLRGWFE